MESSGKIGTLFLKKNIVCILGRRGKIWFLWGVWLAGKKTGKVQRRRVGSVPGLQWFVGRQKLVDFYHADSFLPLWLIKTVKDKRVQRLVRLSVDLARQIGMVLENFQDGHLEQDNVVDGSQIPGKLFSKIKYTDTVEERRQKVHLAKMDTRSRRSHETQSHKLPIRPINPSTLLDSICWSISEPTSVASVYIEQFQMNGIGDHSFVFFDAHGVVKDLQDSFDHFTRPLTEREKEDVLFKNHFLTILSPLDRFGELGPSKTFFSSKGFNCIQVLDHMYKFYQENLSAEEIEMAIHTDSRHANCLRSVYASKDSLERGFVTFKRIEFIGRRSFELLKRVSGENNNNVYELLMRA